ncbi:sodium-dependent bicarbonate transport family permease, partial [Acinetobacter baumannii]
MKPFTSDIFKGFLAIFLLEMGMVAAKRFKAFIQYGWFVTVISIVIPLFNGLMAVWISSFWHIETGNRFMLAI